MLHNEFMDAGFYFLFFPVVFLYGICIGSFLNVVIYRLPRGESLVKRASHCTTCGAKIRIIDIIPIVSWVFILHGKCRSCGEKISSRYPIVEALNGVVYVVTFLVMDFNLKSLLYCLFFSLLICLAFIDYDTMEMDLVLLGLIAVLAIPLIVLCLLPQETLYGLPEFLRDAVEDDTVWDHLIGLVCVGVPFFLIGEATGPIARKFFGMEDIRRGIELGDTLIMAAGGLLIGWKACVVSMFFGLIIASVWGIINKHSSGESKFAFGPALAAGLFLGALFGEPIMDWYIGILTYDPEAVQSIAQIARF
ncbi:MAG: prepilin peptidase [Oscillospiraceae bacterium]|nr:prepilin peptidase [Oscillospiraceae bacterium]